LIYKGKWIVKFGFYTNYLHAGHTPIFH
jgi:hypothetical protein